MGAVLLAIVGIALWIPLRLLLRARKSDEPGSGVGVAVWSIVLICIGAYVVHFLFAPLSGVAVKLACERDGGLHVSKRVFVDTYWHGESMWGVGAIEPDCGLCAAQVASREFVAVDFKRLVDRSRKSDQLVRFQLRPIGDPHCLADRRLTGLAEGECVAEIPLAESAKSGFRYDDNLQNVHGFLGAGMRLHTRTIVDVSSGLSIATHRYYSARTPFEESGSFYPSYTCNDRLEKGFAKKLFIDWVLRDARMRVQ